MAESFLFGIADRIIGSLASDPVKEIASVWGAKKELLELQETVSVIKDVLLDAAEKQVHNHQVRTWLKKLEDAVYEADDLSDDISTEALRRQLMSGSNMIKKVRTFFSSKNQLVFRCKMAHGIKDIKERLAAINNNRRDFQLEVRREETRAVVRGREHTHSYIPQEQVIGRESDRIAILKLLLDPNVEEENVSAVPIVGCGGLGKTSLAQLVYNDEEIQTRFDLKMWVCVSEDFDVRSLAERIIKSATNRGLENLEMDQLQKKLQKQVNGKRYLLVLDDVWNENRESWRSLMILLSNGAKGSKILITTRSQKVGQITSRMEPYMLGILDKDQSWSLFKNVSFKSVQEPKNSNTERIAMEIMNKCGGIPLAIRTIGRMLYSRDPDTEWSSYLEKEFSSIVQDANDILPTLKLSYDSLPSHLKTCFAYCSLFPKDNRIEVDKLIKLWMAQGFIKSSSSTQSLEEVGYEYFKDLHWRSFFQEVEEIYDEKLECKMHDLMHDLAKQVAGEHCAVLRSVPENIDERTRHVNFDFDLNRKTPAFLSRKNKIRTFLFQQVSPKVELTSVDAIVLGLKLVRALDLHGIQNTAVPRSICELKHLRYLDLSWTGNMKTLSNSITKLQNLQTLKLSDCSDLVELPRDLKKLVNLRHLENDRCSRLTHMPSGMGQLTNLHTLNEFVLDRGIGSTSREAASGLNELKELNNLRGKLSITNLRFGRNASVEYKDAKLKDKKHLHSLIFNWQCRSFDDDDDHSPVDATESVDYEIALESLQPHPNLKELGICNFGGVRLASWFPLLTTLDTLFLFYCKKIQNLLPLNELPCLKSLTLYGLSSLQYISDSVTNDLSAPQAHLLSTLQRLNLNGLPNLKWWWKDDHDAVNGEEDDHSCCLPSFTCLSDLFIQDCPRLISMPLYPHLKERLLLKNSSLKTFQQTQMMNTATASSFSPLSNLTDFYLDRIEDLESLPEGLQQLTSLRELTISGCKNFVAIPEWIGNIRSLKTLSISCCDNLTSLPEGMRRLTSLHFLSISRCPLLEQRCERETGEDWHKIAHIPHLSFHN